MFALRTIHKQAVLMWVWASHLLPLLTCDHHFCVGGAQMAVPPDPETVPITTPDLFLWTAPPTPTLYAGRPPSRQRQPVMTRAVPDHACPASFRRTHPSPTSCLILPRGRCPTRRSLIEPSSHTRYDCCHVSLFTYH